jgi:hypothetical protein
MSVAKTFAPSRANIVAVARPIPWPAAVTTAFLLAIRFAIVHTNLLDIMI